MKSGHRKQPSATLSSAGKRPATSTNRRNNRHPFFCVLWWNFSCAASFSSWFGQWVSSLESFPRSRSPSLHTKTANYVKPATSTKSISIFSSSMVFPSQHCPTTIKIHSKANINNMKPFSLSLPLTYPMVYTCNMLAPQLSVAWDQLSDTH